MYVDVRISLTSSHIARLVAIVGILLIVGAKPAQRRIDLDVRGADIHDVVRLLADTGRTNVVVPDAVKGRVTIKLSNVLWTEALAVVLQAAGLGSETSGNIIYVDTLENLRRAATDRAQRRARAEQTGTLVTRMIPLSYADAETLAPLVRSMLTQRGSVVVDKRHNALIVTDVVHNLRAIRTKLER